MGRRTQRSRPEISACEDTPPSTDAPPPHPDFPASSPGPRNQGCGQSAPGAGRLGTVPGRDSRRNESGREAGLRRLLRPGPPGPATLRPRGGEGAGREDPPPNTFAFPESPFRSPSFPGPKDLELVLLGGPRRQSQFP
ncbi:unnamed protein product [Rangifer tarandus platyrhynchus]|uniref:Uncharacterized protein n=1 Tax=Rangifer tarandus platyrhynchus TaxID=3082113 RepID=A0ABN8XSB1_RANTA|nr:unnamed protein product [Rangifer tarandus platyrhynchus]